MISLRSPMRRSAIRRIVPSAIFGFAALFAFGVPDPAAAMRHKDSAESETTAARPAGEPLIAIVSLSNQRVTIYDADGWILRSPVSSGRSGYETPAGIYSVLQKEVEHHSNLYDDALMPFMQRITWSGVALHAGKLPGYPASHGCVRLPYDFAQHLYDKTKVGMRVIIARNDVRPVEIAHPSLFQPRPIPADVGLEAMTDHWGSARADAPEASPPADQPEAPPPPADPAAMRLTLKQIAAIKTAEANAAAKKASAARLTAARLSAEAARLLPAAEGAKARAEAQVASAERILQAAISPTAAQLAQEFKAKAEARLAEAQTQLAAAEADAPLKADAAERARDEAKAAESEKTAAAEAASEATRMLSPVSVFISRKTGRLYVRQAFQQVLESPVTIREADHPIGTHVYTALGYKNGGADLRWSVISVDKKASGDQEDSNKQTRRGDARNAEAALSESGPAATALDRIEIPEDVVERIAEVVSPGSSLIISDEGMSAETGKGTDFVILMRSRSEPQGGVKIRRREPTTQQATRYREDGGPYYRSSYYRAYARQPTYAPSLFGGGLFGSW